MWTYSSQRLRRPGGAGLRGMMLGLVVLVAAVPFVASGVRGPVEAQMAHPKAPWVLGVSNNLVGNGWREEMICAVKAEAVARPGLVKRVLVSDINGGAAEQIAGIRTLISSGANAIIINPPDATSLNGVIQEATQRGIVVVIVDQFVNSDLPYQAANDQVAYGRLGMEWLANRLKGHGNVVLLQGIAGAPADTARYSGIQEALQKYPGIHVVAKPYTGWQWAPGGKQMLDLLNAHKDIDGVWTSGIDYTAVNAFATAHRAFVPMVGADNNEFVHQLLALHGKGLVGAAVTNPATIGGVGAGIAVRVLQGQDVPKKTTLTPEVWDNTRDLATLQTHYLPTQAATYSVQWSVKGFTHYTQKQLFACKSP
jgi:ribose transport system substrate-binding protein